MSQDPTESHPLVTGDFSAIELHPFRPAGDDSPGVSIDHHSDPSGVDSVSGSSTPRTSNAGPSPLETSPQAAGNIPAQLPSQGQTPPVSQGQGTIEPAGSRPQRRSLRATIKLWKGELVAALFAIALTLAQVALFVHYNHEFLFTHHKGLAHTATWPFDFKVNAAFALTNAFIDAALAFCISSCIGQLRWHWYQKKAQSMEWLDIMTNARGAPGATRMLMKKGMHRQYATVGAIGIILLLFTGFMTQQAVSLRLELYPPQGLPQGGRVPIQSAYSWYSKGATNNLDSILPTTNMIASIQSGFDSITSVGNKYAAGNLASCEGTSCHYGEYQSLGVCGTCSTNTGIAINNPCPNRTCTASDYYTLQHPDQVDLSLAATSGLVNLTADTEYPVSEELKDQVGPLIARTTALLHTKQNLSSPVVVSECAAWWCIITYSSNMTNGTLHEQSLREWTDKSQAARTTGPTDRNPINLYPPECFNVTSSTRAVPPKCNYFIGNPAHRGLANFLATSNPNVFGSPFLKGSVTTSLNYTRWNVSSLPVDAILDPLHVNLGIPAVLTDAFGAMTRYMTITLRDTNTASRQYPGWQYGVSFTEKQIFETEWPWLVLPWSVLVATLIFLLFTMLVSRREEIWKSSAMALIFHAFSDADRGGLGDLNSADAMVSNTNELIVQLEPGPSGQWLFTTKSRRMPHGKINDKGREEGGKGAGHAIEIFSQVLGEAK